VSTLSGVAAIVGAYEHPTRKAVDENEWTLTREVARHAIADAGLEPKDIDGFFTPPSAVEGGLLGPGAALLMADYLNIQPSFLDETDVGGASFGYYVNRAIMAMAAGLIRTALITYAALPRSRAVAIGRGDDIAPTPDSFEKIYGLPLVGFYGLLAERYLHTSGLTREQLAAVAVTTRTHAARNPDAMYRKPMTLHDVLASPVIASPLHLLDCCVISDGAAAIVLANKDVASHIRHRTPVWIAGFGEATMNHRAGSGDWVDDTLSMLRAAATNALDLARLVPSQIDAAMIYDAFTVNVPMALEGAGLVPAGDLGAFLESGQLGIGGQLPTNTDGGGLSSNHPGRRGLFMLVEATRQLRGEAGERQVDACDIVACVATGAASLARRASAVHILTSGPRDS
jgi:acetyl-CoA C-acetyltransferase